jgi:hypothetical protein
MKIIQQRKLVEIKTYSHEFSCNDCEGAGYSFQLDTEKKPTLKSPEAKENYQGCLTGEFDVRDLGIQTHINRYREPAIGQCDCGAKLELRDPLDNYCKCGQVFNLSGQRVTPSNYCDDLGNPLSDYDY